MYTHIPPSPFGGANILLSVSYSCRSTITTTASCNRMYQTSEYFEICEKKGSKIPMSVVFFLLKAVCGVFIRGRVRGSLFELIH